MRAITSPPAPSWRRDVPVGQPDTRLVLRDAAP
jgi:hypothetical protein